MPHKVDDRAIFTMNLLAYFNGEADGSEWYAYGRTSDNRHIVKHSAGAALPRPEQRQFSADLAGFLNDHLALDGAWWILLKELHVAHDEKFRPYVEAKSFEMIFIDADGDAQIAVESEDQHWTDWLLKGRQHWGEVAYAAWQEAGEFKHDVDARNLPTIRSALGERSNAKALR